MATGAGASTSPAIEGLSASSRRKIWIVSWRFFESEVACDAPFSWTHARISSSYAWTATNPSG